VTESSVEQAGDRVRARASRLQVLIVAAHADDETIGASTMMARMPGCHLIHVTDGAPRGIPDRQDHARRRRHELLRAMSHAGVDPSSSLCLDVVDQEASLALVWIARRLADAITIIRPDFVLTHAYEGGHPDHDAIAFATWAAARLIAARGGTPPARYEMALYHGEGGELRVGRFLPRTGATVIEAVLSTDELALRHAMLDCFESQRAVLAPFYESRAERFRAAPTYDFTRPPHPGALWYEQVGLSMTGATWRELASRALAELRRPLEAAVR
jgi:N-acetylglucosamine malate deacetylase 2